MGRSRQRKRPRLAWMGLLALFAVLLAACADAADAPAPSLHLGGRVTIALASQPGVLLPAAASDAATAEVDAAIWAPLFYQDSSLTIQPELAQEVPTLANGDISANGTTIRIVLRTGLKWSDGQPLTAADVVYAFDMLSDASYTPAPAFPVGEILNAVAVNPYTVQVTLAHADASFIARRLTGAANFAPLPKHIFGNATAAELATTQEGALPAVTSGPFTVSNRSAGETDLTKNLHYNRAPKPALDSLVFKNYSGEDAVVAALQSGDADTASNLSGTAYTSLTTLMDSKQLDAPNASSFDALYFNFASPIVSDATVREALAIGLDPSPLRQTLWQNLAKPTCDVAVGTPAHQPKLVNANGFCTYGLDAQHYDATLAAPNTLLDQDGWTRAATDTQAVRTKDGQPLTLRILVEEGNADQHTIALGVIAQWKSLGVTAQELALPAEQLQDALLHPVAANGAAAYDLVLLRTSLGADPGDSALFSSGATPAQGGENVMGYSNVQVDAWENQQLALLDPTARIKLLQQIQAQILRDVPLIFLYSVPQLSVAKSTITNYAPSGLGPSETWNVADWYLPSEHETPTAIRS